MSKLLDIVTEIETWGTDAISAAETMLGGGLLKLGAQGLSDIGAAAAAYKAAKTATPPATDSAAWAAAYNVLSAGAGSLLTSAELDIADVIITITGG